MKETKKLKLAMPHSLVIIVMIMITAIILTWIIPAGSFDRYENSLGVTVIDPDSFKYVNANFESFLDIPNFMIDGYLDSMDLILMILFSGGAFDVVTSSGALHAAVS